MNSNKDILDRAIGRPAMMGFMVLLGTYLATGQLIPGWFQMDNSNRNIDSQKIKAEKLNGRFAILGVIALVGAYVTTGQIIPGIV